MSTTSIYKEKENRIDARGLTVSKYLRCYKLGPASITTREKTVQRLITLPQFFEAWQNSYYFIICL